MVLFREHYQLAAFTFKEIDKFLWLYGGEDPNATGSGTHI